MQVFYTGLSYCVRVRMAPITVANNWRGQPNYTRVQYAIVRCLACRNREDKHQDHILVGCNPEKSRRVAAWIDFERLAATGSPPATVSLGRRKD